MNFLFNYPNGIPTTLDVPPAFPPHLVQTVQDILDATEGTEFPSVQENVRAKDGGEGDLVSGSMTEEEESVIRSLLDEDAGGDLDLEFFSSFPDDGRVPAGMPEDLKTLWDDGDVSVSAAQLPDISSLAASIGVRIDTTSRLNKAKVVISEADYMDTRPRLAIRPDDTTTRVFPFHRTGSRRLGGHHHVIRVDGDRYQFCNDPVFGEVDPSVHVPGEGTADGSDEELAAFGLLPST